MKTSRRPAAGVHRKGQSWPDTPTPDLFTRFTTDESTIQGFAAAYTGAQDKGQSG
ncbi:MAG: hypothetical protein PVF55_07565 [Desulfobacterales bacterium]|jgi:hypothetical protein